MPARIRSARPTSPWTSASRISSAARATSGPSTWRSPRRRPIGAADRGRMRPISNVVDATNYVMLAGEPAARVRSVEARRGTHRRPAAHPERGDPDARRHRPHADDRGSRDRRRRAPGRDRRRHGRRGQRGHGGDDSRPPRGGELRAERDPADVGAARAAVGGLGPVGGVSTPSRRGRRAVSAASCSRSSPAPAGPGKATSAPSSRQPGHPPAPRASSSSSASRSRRTSSDRSSRRWGSRSRGDWNVTVPTWRARDVTREVDLIEEVGRMKLDEVPFTLPARRCTAGSLPGSSSGAPSRTSSWARLLRGVRAQPRADDPERAPIGSRSRSRRTWPCCARRCFRASSRSRATTSTSETSASPCSRSRTSIGRATTSFPTARPRRRPRAGSICACQGRSRRDPRRRAGRRNVRAGEHPAASRPDGDDDRRDPRRAPARAPGGRLERVRARPRRARSGADWTYEDVITYPPLKQDLALPCPGGARDGSGGSCTRGRAGAPVDGAVRRLSRRPGRRGASRSRSESSSARPSARSPTRRPRGCAKIVAAVGERFAPSFEPRGVVEAAARAPGPCPRSAASARAGSGSSDP